MNIWASIYRHHRWSNLLTIDFLSGLTDEQLALTVPGTYGNSLDTIRHLISSDADYVRIIPDTPDLPQIGQDGQFEGWGRVAHAADTALITCVDGLTEDRFFVDIDDGEVFDLTLSFMLGQILHHATEHRCQIRTTLSSHGIKPPEISVWAWRKSDEGQALLCQLGPMNREESPGG